LYYSSNHLTYASRNPLISLKRINPFRVVAAWKRGDAPRSDLLPVVLLGFLSNAFLMIGVLLNLSSRPVRRSWVQNATSKRPRRRRSWPKQEDSV